MSFRILFRAWPKSISSHEYRVIMYGGRIRRGKGVQRKVGERVGQVEYPCVNHRSRTEDHRAGSLAH